jgi:hypothetical protein
MKQKKLYRNRRRVVEVVSEGRKNSGNEIRHLVGVGVDECAQSKNSAVSFDHRFHVQIVRVDIPLQFGFWLFHELFLQNILLIK